MHVPEKHACLVQDAARELGFHSFRAEKVRCLDPRFDNAELELWSATSFPDIRLCALLVKVMRDASDDEPEDRINLPPDSDTPPDMQSDKVAAAPEPGQCHHAEERKVHEVTDKASLDVLGKLLQPHDNRSVSR